MKRIIAKILVVAILLTTMTQSTMVYAQTICETSENMYVGDGYEVNEKIESQWDDGYVATITVKNTTDHTIENWSLYFPVDSGVENIWNVNIDACDDNWILVSNLGWNKNILPGESVSFGYVASSKFVEFTNDFVLIDENNMEETVQSRSTVSTLIKKAIKVVIKNKNKLVNVVGKYIGQDAAVAVGDVIHDLTPSLRKLLQYEDMGWDTVEGVCKSALIAMGMKSSTAGTVAYYVRKGLEWL